MSTVSIEVATRSAAVLGEGPHWDDDEKVLYYVDIMGKEVRRYDPATKQETVAKIDDATISFVIPVYGEKNTFLISVGLDICLMTWDGRSERPAKIEKLAAVGHPGGRESQLNDGKADSSGRLWTGTVGKQVAPKIAELHQASLYSFSITESVTKQVEKISCSNGLTWSQDNKTMYYIDTYANKVESFNFDVDKGQLSNRQTVFDFISNNVSGMPDGMTIDNNGKLWVACFGANQVIQIDPDRRELLQTISFPTPNVTSVAFGGPDLDELYVTSGTLFLTPEEVEKYPTTGCIYRVKGINAKGLPMFKVKM